jgi:hypothetical protein
MYFYIEYETFIYKKKSIYCVIKLFKFHNIRYV